MAAMGGDLDSLLADRGSLSQAEAMQVAHGVATALSAAHGAGVVHGGLGPDLVLIDAANGEVQVGGLGGPLEGPARASGSDACRAPELVAGDDADARSDLYALGCLLMLMLTGSPPASPSPAGPEDGADASAVGAPWPSDRLPEVDPALDGLVHDLLATSAALRPESADEVVRRLERIQADLGDHAIPVVLPVRETDLPDTAEEHSVLAALGFAAAADTVAEASESRTQSIPVVVPEQEGRPAGDAALLPGSVPRTWLAGSAAAVVLVLAMLILALLGGGSHTPLAATPSSTAPTEVTPSTSEPTQPPSSTATTANTTTTTTTTTTQPSSSTTTAAASPPTRARTASPAPAPRPQPVTLSGAIDALRAAARGAVSSGAVDSRAGEELVRRADDLARWLDRNRSQLERRTADLTAYLDELRRTGQITGDGYRRVSSALDAVRSRL